MPTATEKKPRARKTTPTAAKLHAVTLDIPTPSAPPTELLMVPVELIDCAPQVRTEFDDASLNELAMDIAQRGILQPLLLRPRLNGSYRYLVIAGERRLRAARLAALPAVPAMIGEVDDAAAQLMQLAENIQREELSLLDEANAIRALFDSLGSLQAVAAKVHKSKPWVSKRMSLTCPEFHWDARRLLEDGLCEDLETLLALSTTYRYSWLLGQELSEKIRAGNAGRQTARDYAAQAKAAAEAPPPPITEDEEDETPDAQPEPRPLRALLYTVERAIEDPDTSAPAALLAELDDGERTRLNLHLEPYHTQGYADGINGRGWRGALQKSRTLIDEDLQWLEFAAYLEGAQLNDWKLMDLLTKIFEECRP